MLSTTRPMCPAEFSPCSWFMSSADSSMCANLSHVPSLPKTVAAIVGAGVGAAIAFPPSRRQLLGTGRAALVVALLRFHTPWSSVLLLVTTEGPQTHLPRTAVLSRVEVGGDTYVVPWDR